MYIRKSNESSTEQCLFTKQTLLLIRTCQSQKLNSKLTVLCCGCLTNLKINLFSKPSFYGGHYVERGILITLIRHSGE